MASSSAPTASYNVSVAQAVLTLSINAVLLWLTTFIKSYSSSSSLSLGTAPNRSTRRSATMGTRSLHGTDFL